VGVRFHSTRRIDGRWWVWLTAAVVVGVLMLSVSFLLMWFAVSAGLTD
jgi:hypothetical protein